MLSKTQVTEVSQILNSQNPSLALLKREVGMNIPVSILVDLINPFLDFFNVGKTMSIGQVIHTAQVILEDYSVLKPDDFVLFFNRAKKSWYGKVYDRLDGALIIEWLELFMVERNQEIELIRINEAKRIKRELDEINIAVPMPKEIKDLADKITKKEKPEPVYILNQTEQQRKIQAVIMEFEQLARDQGWKSGKMFAEVDGKMLDVAEYLEYKFK